MRRIAPVLAFLAMVSATAVCAAEPPKGEPGKGGEGKGRDGQGRMAQRMADPAKMVERMMQEFDKDGDQKLDAKELTALLTSMRERIGQGVGAAVEGQRKRGGDGTGRSDGAGRPEGAGRPGGDRPKRPEID